MIRLLLAFGDVFLYLLLCMAAVAGVIGLVAGAWTLLCWRPRREIGYIYGATPTAAEAAEWEADDHLPADGAWTAHYPPGSLGPYPDGRPGPGRLPRRVRGRHTDRLLRQIEAQQRVDARRRGHA